MCYMKLECAFSLIISSGLLVREDETVGWHHWLDGHEFEQTQEESEGPGKPGMLQSIGLHRVRCDELIEEQHHHCGLESHLGEFLLSD